MSTTSASTMTMRVVMMRISVMMMTGMGRPVWKEVNNHEDTTCPEPSDEPFGRQPWVIEVMEAKPHAYYVEVGESGSISESLGVLVIWYANVAVVSKHLVLRQALISSSTSVIARIFPSRLKEDRKVTLSLHLLAIGGGQVTLTWF